MGLDDRAADRQPYSHSITFRCIERFEEFGCSFGAKTDSRIFHAKTHLLALLAVGFDQQHSGAVLNVDHRLRTVAEHVQYDLLELDSVARDRGEIARELRPQDHAISLK